MSAAEAALVIDDDPAVARLLAIFLDRLGLRVTVAGSSTEAEAQLVSPTDWRLMITDLQLGDRGGREGLHLLGLCRERRPGCRRILISGSVGLEIANEAQDHGADLFLTKPVSLGTLTDAVRSLLAV